MKILRKPWANAAIISAVSLFYALTFILTSGHLEFERVLDHGATLGSAFWNGWSAFLRQGNMKYVGCAYILLTAAIAALSLARGRDYDEYQAGILEKGVTAMGGAMVLLFPIALLLVLSDRQYAVETLMLLVTAHWTIVLIADLAYTLRWARQ